MNKPLGRHILCEAYGCDPEVLTSRALVETVMVDAALQAGAEIREVAFHQFSPHGVSGVVVISESHLAIHTWPEYGYAAIDVFTCGDRVDPWDACKRLLTQFGAKHSTTTEIERGTFRRQLLQQQELVSPV
ncbi:MAG: adenosylmethionine decarboxylase [Limnochordia bacterium]|jgi:S-adenosylmethionine decarboxylase